MCHFFESGRCTKGNACEFYHPKVCKYYKTKDGCSKGDDCKDMHLKGRAAAAGKGKAKAKAKAGTRVLIRAVSPAVSDDAMSAAGGDTLPLTVVPTGETDFDSWQTVSRKSKRNKKWMTSAYMGKCCPVQPKVHT